MNNDVWTLLYFVSNFLKPNNCIEPSENKRERLNLKLVETTLACSTAEIWISLIWRNLERKSNWNLVVSSRGFVIFYPANTHFNISLWLNLFVQANKRLKIRHKMAASRKGCDFRIQATQISISRAKSKWYIYRTSSVNFTMDMIIILYKNCYSCR